MGVHFDIGKILMAHNFFLFMIDKKQIQKLFKCGSFITGTPKWVFIRGEKSKGNCNTKFVLFNYYFVFIRSYERQD